MIIGDFNEILHEKEKWGGNQFNASKAKACLDFIASSNLIDLGYVGPKFTWTNKRRGLANVKERLHEALDNVKWRTMFPKSIFSLSQ